MSWEDVVKVAEADVRRIERGETGMGAAYLGIQRRLSPKREKEIAQYVQTIDATFPTSIILAVKARGIYEEPLTETSQDELFQRRVPGDFEEEDNVQFNEGDSTLTLRADDRIARIIDGQHRLAGLKMGHPSGKFDLIVTLFVDIAVADQAAIFATINLEQTKVNKSLVYDLYAYAKSRSPQRTAHSIAVVLNKRDDSPFFRRIKRLGSAEHETETITQSTFVESLLELMTRNAPLDADRLKRGQHLEPDKSLPLRQLFIDEQDDAILLVISDYFKEISNKWPTWNQVHRGAILSRSTGFVSLMWLLRDLLSERAVTPGDRADRKNLFRSALARVSITDVELTSENFKPGSSGRAALYRRLRHEALGHLGQ